MVAKDDWAASFALEDMKPNRPAKITNGDVRYDDVAAGVSLDYRMLSNGLKEDIVLDQPLPAGSPDHFRFRLAVNGAAPVAVDGGTAVSLQDGAGHELARIPRGTMVDAKGVKASSTCTWSSRTGRGSWTLYPTQDSFGPPIAPTP